MPTAHEEFAHSLRQLAAFIEGHPEIPVPLPTSFSAFVHPTHAPNGMKAHAAATIRALGKVKKEDFESNIQVIHDFGPLTYQVWYPRKEICERVVTGTREVPEHVLPAQEERVIPAHTEEIVEWHCAPILAPGPEAVSA